MAEGRCDQIGIRVEFCDVLPLTLKPVRYRIEREDINEDARGRISQDVVMTEHGAVFFYVPCYRGVVVGIRFIERYCAILRPVLFERTNKTQELAARHQYVDVVIPRNESAMTNGAQNSPCGTVIGYIMLFTESIDLFYKL